MTDSSSIERDVESLRAQCPDTRALYREVCALLFFRYGITPTANRLYQLVRRGSMNVPSEELSRFWASLREKSRVRLEAPDLPERVREQAAELVGCLWTEARSLALADWGAQRAACDEELRATMAEVRQAKEHALAESERAARVEREMAAMRQREIDLSRDLTLAQGRLASLSELLHEASDELSTLRRDLALAQRDVDRATGEANALRVQLAIERQRRSRRPLAGLPGTADQRQDDLRWDSGRSDTRDVVVDAPATRAGEPDEADVVRPGQGDRE